MRLWKVWWLGGLPVVGVLTWLSLLSEDSWRAGYPALADLLAVLRLVIYWLWLRAVWKYSPNVGYWLWAPLARIGVATGLIFTALT